MAHFLDDELNNVDDQKYEEYLQEAKKKIDPSKISEDEDGLIWWFFRCLYTDCRNHEFANRRYNYEEELKLAAESQVICEILNSREGRDLDLALAI